MSCHAMFGPDGCPQGFECGRATKVRYPGNDPENGAAREYCADGHSKCYNCGRWFQAIVELAGWTDEETGQYIKSSTHESDWCKQCEEQHRMTRCGCGQDVRLHMHSEWLDESKKAEWMCCGDYMCCERSER